MEPRQHRLLLVAAVCTLAIVLAAAALETPVTPPPGGGPGAGSVTSPGSDPGGGTPAGSGGPACVPWLATPWIGLALLGVLAAGAMVTARLYGRLEAVAFAAGLGLPLLGVYAFLTACATGGVAAVIDRITGLVGVLSARAGGDGDPTVPVVLVAGYVLVGACLAALAVYLTLADREGRPDGSDDGEDGDPDATAAAAAAGDAAARIAEGHDPDNEIFRAWREMAAALDVPRPEASTPGEFADAAVDAGLDPDAVRELTALFEAARYGGFEATPDRARRARAALERIEDTSAPSPGGEERTDG